MRALISDDEEEMVDVPDIPDCPYEVERFADELSSWYPPSG